MRKTYYYHDELNDDFAGTKINTKLIPDDYKYVDRSLFFRAGENVLRFIAYPIIFVTLKTRYLMRYKNRKTIKKFKKQGYFIFGNHTNCVMDVFNPSLISFPKKVHIIANPDAMSIKGLATVIKMLGAVPIPTSFKGMRNYRKGIEELLKLNRVIAIYPEAHVWPYYTDVRDFGTQSFHYAVDFNSPCFAFTNIYTKRRLKFIKRPKVVTYIDGPFYPDLSLGKKDAVEKLRNDVYNAMKKRVDENPKYNYCDYVYVDDPALVTNTHKKKKKEEVIDKAV